MLDENETGTSREDALSAYESLFGDTAADPAAAVAEERKARTRPTKSRRFRTTPSHRPTHQRS